MKNTDYRNLDIVRIKSNKSSFNKLFYFNKNKKDYNLLDREIKKIIYENFNNNIFDVEYLLQYANENIQKRVNDKPYLIEFDIINETIIEYLGELELKKNKEETIKNYKFYFKKRSEIIKLWGQYKSRFSNTLEINYKKEIELNNLYIEKLKEDKILSKGEVEELIKLYISGGIKNQKREILNYILKNIYKSNYQIKEYLYERIFLAKVNEYLENNKELKVKIVYLGEKETWGQYNHSKKVINIDKEQLKSKALFYNFLTFFHEKRHYEQSSDHEISIASLSYAKERILGNFVPGYYNKNYYSVSYEKDAEYSSLKDMYYLMLEIVPGEIETTKKKIYDLLTSYSAKGIEGRIKENYLLADKVENFNLFFESERKKNKKIFAKLMLEGKLPPIFLYEYDIKGNKRTLFELFDEKDKIEQTQENSKKIHLYEYLIYREEVSIEYILSNLILLNKFKKSKYYNEVKQTLKQRIFNYFITINESIANNNLDEVKKIYLESFILNLKKMSKKNFALTGDKNAFLKEEENLKIGYEELLCILNELNEKDFESKKR